MSINSIMEDINMKTLTQQEIQNVSGALAFFDKAPGWGATIGGFLGGAYGVPGSAAGAALGHAFEVYYPDWRKNHYEFLQKDNNWQSFGGFDYYTPQF